MKKLLLIIVFVFIAFMLSSCPKQAEKPISGGSPGVYAKMSSSPIVTHDMLKNGIDQSNGDYISIPNEYGWLLPQVYYHKATDEYGSYNASGLTDNIDENSAYYKTIETLFDAYLPNINDLLFIGCREVVNGKVVKYARLLTKEEQRDIVIKIYDMELLKSSNLSHSDFIPFKYYDEHINDDYIIVSIASSFVSSGYPSDKVKVEAFVKWLEDKYWSTIAKEANIVKCFPWDNVGAPRPEKY